MKEERFKELRERDKHDSVFNSLVSTLFHSKSSNGELYTPEDFKDAWDYTDEIIRLKQKGERDEYSR